MTTQRKIFLFILLGLGLLSCLYALLLWKSGPREVQQEAGIPITADSLFSAYSLNEKKANQLFLDKIVVVTGIISSVSKNQDGKTVVLLQTSDPMFGISCSMEQESIALKEGNTVSMKGICTGFLTDVVLIRCSLQQSKH